MDKLTRKDLMSLEDYALRRAALRLDVIEHKKQRQVALGPHATLLFEDRRTIHYQIQEMLRVERIFEPDAIAQELEAYNPLIPDGDNWKATLMIEYADADERREALSRLVGVEDRVWVRVGARERIWAIADEDLDRSRAGKTAAVHFLRFQLPEDVVRDVLGGAALAFGIAHAACREQQDPVPPPVRESLAGDLEPRRVAT